MPVHMMGCEVRVAFYTPEEMFDGVDIVFFNRTMPKIDLKTLLEYRSKYGFKLVCDLDDHWNLDPTHILYDGYKEWGISENIAEHIKVSDAIFVTHERLYNEVLPLNKNAHIIPNAIAKEDQFTIDKFPSDKIRLFWAGGVTHRNDIELLRNPAKRINSDKVKWVIGGYQKNNPEWRSMASAFTGGGKFDHDIIQAMGVHEYYKAYSQCDIALIPLVDNSFNQYKSNLKILEAANISAPVVVSRVNPYLNFPEDIVNYVSKQGDWYTQTKRLIDNPALIKEQGERLKEYCDIHYNFNEINKLRKQIFHELIQRSVREVPLCADGENVYADTRA